MKINRRWLILGILILVVSMVFATQYAITKVQYEYAIVHPSDAGIRYIGSDNSTDGVRVLRIIGSNSTNVSLMISLGNYSANTIVSFSAAFGIVNEEHFSLNITHINVTSLNETYMQIWLHGNRSANAIDNTTDNSSVLMYDNGTIVHPANTTAWTLAPGDGDPSNMCSNISDRLNYTIPTSWDETTHVRFSENDTNAISGTSDFVWVQVTLNIPESVDSGGPHTGVIMIYLESNTH